MFPIHWIRLKDIPEYDGLADIVRKELLMPPTLDLWLALFKTSDPAVVEAMPWLAQYDDYRVTFWGECIPGAEELPEDQVGWFAIEDGVPVFRGRDENGYAYTMRIWRAWAAQGDSRIGAERLWHPVLAGGIRDSYRGLEHADNPKDVTRVWSCLKLLRRLPIRTGRTPGTMRPPTDDDRRAYLNTARSLKKPLTLTQAKLAEAMNPPVSIDKVQSDIKALWNSWASFKREVKGGN